MAKAAGARGQRWQKRPGPALSPGLAHWGLLTAQPRCRAARESFPLLHVRPRLALFFTQPGVSCRSPRTTASMPVYGTNAHCGTAHSGPEPPGPAVQPASASPTLGLQARATAPGCAGLCLRAPSTAAPPSPASAAPQRCSSTLAAAAGTPATFNPSTEQPAQYFGLERPGYAVVG